MSCLSTILKYFFLFLLSIVQSFNYMSHIPFMILYLNTELEPNNLNYILLVIFLVVYDITKYIFSFLLIKLIKLLDIHELISISICFLTMVQLIFSFILYYKRNLYIFILYRILLSLFNNINFFISSPIIVLFKNKKIPYKLKFFAILQRVTNFLLFPVFLYLMHDYLSIFCFFLSIICFICFVLYVIVFICMDNKKYTINYYPQISEKESQKHKNDLIFEQNVEQKNNSYSPGKKFKFLKKHTNINNVGQNNSASMNNDLSGINSNNINQLEYKSENYGDNTNLVIIPNNDNNAKNYLYNNGSKNIDINTDNNGLSNEILKNFREIENKNISENFKTNTVKFKKNEKQEIIINKELANALDVVSNPNNSKFEINNKLAHNNILIQTSVPSGNNKTHKRKQVSKMNNMRNSCGSKNKLNVHTYNEKMIKNKYKIIFTLVYSAIKFINHFSLFMLILKYYSIKNVLNEYKINGITSNFGEIILMFSCYYFINIFLLPFNKMMTTLAIKKRSCVKKCSFYPALLIFLITSEIFSYLFLENSMHIRKNIILCFIFEIIMYECSMIILSYYNASVIVNGLNQYSIKDMKSFGNFLGGISFIVVNFVRWVFIVISKIKLFDSYFFYGVFSFFILLVLIIGIKYV